VPHTNYLGPLQLGFIHYGLSLFIMVFKKTFNNRIVPVWSFLPDEVVSVYYVSSCKNKWDKFWFDQESRSAF
jgi:hypothetical protein